MRKVLFIFMIAIFAFGANMEVLSKNFKYNQQKNIAVFRGDVNVTKGGDNILSDVLYLYTSKNKKLDKMIAEGNVSFVLKDTNSTYKGNSDKLTYIALKELFIFEGKVHITKVEDNQQLFGDKVIINKKDGTANVIGNKNKPLKFIIKVNE